MSDEYDAPVIVLADGLLGISHPDGRFNVIQVELGASDVSPMLVGMDRQAAERLAVWLRCQLDATPARPVVP